MEDLRESSKILHHEVSSISRNTIIETDKEQRTTLPYYSKYEYTCLLGTRAQQLAEGSKPLTSTDGLRTEDPQFIWKLAKKEILEQKLPFIIHRHLPNGKSEFWSTMELSVIW
jgi:DNA-directed RNA polymerase I, II, and III subunit RPABC2